MQPSTADSDWAVSVCSHSVTANVLVNENSFRFTTLRSLLFSHRIEVPSEVRCRRAADELRTVMATSLATLLSLSLSLSLFSLCLSTDRETHNRTTECRLDNVCTTSLSENSHVPRTTPNDQQSAVTSFTISHSNSQATVFTHLAELLSTDDSVPSDRFRIAGSTFERSQQPDRNQKTTSVGSARIGSAGHSLYWLGPAR
jgi:hypothetical protein